MIRVVKVNHSTITYELTQTQRKNMLIRIGARGIVRLYAPKHTPLKRADDFVIENAEWIQSAQAEYRRQSAQLPENRPLHSGAQILYEGVLTPILILPAPQNQINFDGRQLRILAADTAEPAVRQQLRTWLQDRASTQIAARTKHYAPFVGQPYNRITIRAQRTRWGSCSAQRNLNFNWKLIMAPPEALDYVVVHELCHLHDFNHSPKFWANVARFLPDYQTWKDWLKENGHMLGL